MVNPLDLTGQRVLVTGASAGIGQATALLLSRLGAGIVAVGRDAERLNQSVAALEGSGHHPYQQDLSDTAAIPAMLQTIAQETGPLSGLVHCAGVNLPRPLKVLTSRDLTAVHAINAEAAVMLAKGFRRKGVCAGGGSIVLISSVAALRGQPGLAAYAASKGALLALTRTLAVELARERIRVNCLCPGVVETAEAGRLRERLSDEAYQRMVDSYPLGFGTPQDVANSVAFFLSDASRWITGTSLVLDGGYSA